MKTYRVSIATAAVAAATAAFVLAMAAPGEAQMMMRGGGMARHHFFMMNGIPEVYRGKRNPLPADAANIAAGIEIFQENCALCHGATGRGDGEGAKDLDPRPADLMVTMNMPISTDDFLFWTVSEGGEPLGTDMPAFGDVLAEKEIWQVILALRAHLQPAR